MWKSSCGRTLSSNPDLSMPDTIVGRSCASARTPTGVPASTTRHIEGTSSCFNMILRTSPVVGLRLPSLVPLHCELWNLFCKGEPNAALGRVVVLAHQVIAILHHVRRREVA